MQAVETLYGNQKGTSSVEIVGARIQESQNLKLSMLSLRRNDKMSSKYTSDISLSMESNETEKAFLLISSGI